MENHSKFWDFLSQSYDKNTLKKYSNTYKKTIEKICTYLETSNNVLDIGCGTGIITIEIASNVNKVLAIDYSQKMLDIAKKKI